MATLSRKTLGVAVHCIEGWSRTSIEAFFYEMDVPDTLIAGGSKLKTVLNVFKVLEAEGRMDFLAKIVFAVADRLQGPNRTWLHKALMKDGFVLGKGGVAVDVPVAEDNRTALEILVARNSAHLSAATLVHHLHESVDLFRQEKWDSSISHARNFVEQLLRDIAQAIATKKQQEPNLSRAVHVRRYLQDCSFLDQAEKERLVEGVYGYFSEEGSHPGISTQSAARVCMHILWAFGFYVLEKFGNWLANEDQR